MMEVLNRVDFHNKKTDKKGFVELRNLDENAKELYFYGDISSVESDKTTYEDVCPSDVIEMVSNIGNSNLVININSCGGSVFGGITIYNELLRQCKGSINVNITGLCASIATVIAMAGETINMGIGSQMMIHKPLCGAIGNADDMENVIEILNKCQDSILDVYMEKANDGVTREQLSNLMNKSSYLNVSECKALFNNVVTTSKVSSCLSNHIENKVLKDVPVEETKDDEKLETENVSELIEEVEEIQKDSVVDKEQMELKNKLTEIDNFEKELSIFLCLK